MRKSMLIVLILCSVSAIAQEAPVKPVKKISVSGSATMEVVPDEIYVQINLKEYKDGSRKVDLNQLEAELVAAVKKLKIPEENLRVQNVSGYNWNWKKRKAEEFLATKSFQLKVSDLKLINDLVEKLDAEGVNSMNVMSYDHSKVEEYRKTLKIEAMKAAKTKATYLLEAVGEKLGGVLEVVEGSANVAYPMNRSLHSNVAFESTMNDDYQSDLEFQKIKLKAEVQVVFEIE